MQMTFAFRKQPRVLVLLGVLPVLTLVFGSSLSAQGPRKTPHQNSVGALIASECDAVPGNIVANCGFESGAFGPWTFSGVDPINTRVEASGHSGSFGAFLGSTGGLGCITQTLTTVAATSYTLSFWLNNPASPNTPNNFQVWFGPPGLETQVAGDLLNMPSFDYTKFTIGGLIGSGTDTVSFCARNEPSFFGLDDIVVK